MSVHFLYFLFNWRVQEKLNQQVCLIKLVENEISNSASHKKKKMLKKRERGAKTYSNFKKIISKSPGKLSVVTLVTNYYKLSLLPFVVRPWQKFEKKSWC